MIVLTSHVLTLYSLKMTKGSPRMSARALSIYINPLVHKFEKKKIILTIVQQVLMAETNRPECVRLWREYIELILFRGSIFVSRQVSIKFHRLEHVQKLFLCSLPQIWSPIAFLTSCLILATVNGGLVFTRNLLTQYIDGGCFGLSTVALRSDTQAVAAFILAIAVIAVIAEVVILVIRAGQFGIKIKEINKYLTILLVVVS